jgi:MinD-like ATPase involved in chromosome partitioning or flagellar assembly
MVKSIAIVSLGKNTGKTTVALNLGLALHQLNHKVLVFDTDFTKNNMLEHLEIHNLPKNISQVLEGDTHITDVVYKHISGMKLIPSAIHNSTNHGYDLLSYHYQDLLGDYDYIILDTPIEQPHLDIVLQNADEAIIVHSPNHSSKIVFDAINLLSRLKVLNLGIVLNNSSEDSVDEIYGYPILEKIPTHKDIKKSYELKNPVLHTHPKSKIAPKFHRLAKRFE